MSNPTAGLRVRFFSVISASGFAVWGKSTGNIPRSRFLGGNCIAIRGTIDKKLSVASKAARTGQVELTTPDGTASPLARKTSETTPA
jgi:hypothetical protein